MERDLSPDLIAKAQLALSQLGAPEPVNVDHFEWRYSRWIGQLAPDFMVFIADTDEAARQLAKERKVLNLLHDRVPFEVPKIAFSAADDTLQVCRMIPGIQVGGAGFERTIAASVIGPRLAAEVGCAFAQLHQAVSVDECIAIGIDENACLPTADDLKKRLEPLLKDRIMKNALLEVATTYRNNVVPQMDVVFVHGDPWGFAVDPTTGSLNGLFDFDEMCVGDRNLDLRYFHSFGDSFRNHAFAEYEHESGVTPSLDRANLYHLVAAFDSLADALTNGDADMIARREAWVSDAINELL